MKFRNKEYWLSLWAKKGDLLFQGTICLVLFLVFVITLYPMVFAISASVSSPSAVASGRMLLFPVECTLCLLYTSRCV